MIKKAILAIALLGITFSQTFAQSKNEVPRLLTYQAQLLDKEGKIVPDGEHAITAKLYTDDDGDQVLWGDTYLVRTRNGVMDLLLGSGDNELPPSSQLSRALWLGISLDGAEEMRPLLPFSAVPYALNVANNSITSSKMATDYVASFSINGQQITGRGGKIDLYAGNGVKLTYDSISNQLMIMGSRSTGTKGEAEVLTVSLYAKEDIVVDGNATFNVDSGKTDMRGNVIIGSSSSKTVTFKAKSASDLDMNGNSLTYADSLTLGKVGSYRGVMQVVTHDKAHNVTIKADSAAANRTYTIPDVGEDSRFLMTSGLQTIDTLLFTNIMVPSNDNAYALGDPDLRYRDIYMGPGSLHLIASVDEGVTEEVDYAQQIDVNEGDGNGDLVFRESGDDLLRIAQTGDMTVTGSTTTDGMTTSGDIQPVDDNTVQIGSEETRIADIYLGPGSLHLIASVDDGVTEDVDYAQQVDVGDSAGNGDLVFRESGDDLLRITQTGDVTVTGTTTTDGMTTSGDIQPIDDNTVQIGSEETRIADIYLGPGSLHLIASVDDGVTEDVDYAQQVDVSDSAGNGDLVFRESGDDLLRITQTGDVTVTGSTTTDGVTTSGDIQPIDDNTVQIGSEETRIADIYLGPGSLHLIASVDDGVTEDVDYAQQVDVSDSAGNGDLVFRESGEDLLRIAPTGDVTVTGSTTTDGVVTSGDVVPTTDNTVTLGSTDSRYMDIFVGPGSIHVSGTSSELNNAPSRDWVLDLLQSGPDAGNFQILESGNLALSMTPSGNAAITGKATSASTLLGDAATTLTTKDYVDAVGASKWGLNGNGGTNGFNYIGTSDAAPFVVKTNGTERLRVLATGEVGIGNANPLTTLDVTGGFRVSGPATVIGTLNFDGALFGMGNGSVSGSFAAKDLIAGSAPNQYGRIFIYDADGTDATISTSNMSTPRAFTLPDASGTIALTSDISATVWSKTGNAGTSAATNFIGSTDAQDVVLRANNSERLRLNSAGGVNISGNADISGDASVTGGITIGGSTTLNSGATVSGPIVAGSSFSAEDYVITASYLQSGTNMAAGSLKLKDGVFGTSELRSSTTGESLVFYLPETAGTLALSGTGWDLAGNAGTNASHFIGTTDANPLTFKTNNVARLSISSTGAIQLMGTATLGGDLNATGYSISNVGQVGAQIVNITTQLNVTNVGGHTMVGGLNMNSNDIASVDDLGVSDIDASGIVTVRDEFRVGKPSSLLYSSFEANEAQSSNIVYTLPASQGTAGSTLQNDGSGNLTWGTHVHRDIVNKSTITIAANGSQTVTFAVTGPANAAVFVSPENALPSGVVMAYARMSAADTAEIRLMNLTVASVNLSSQNWSIGIIH